MESERTLPVPVVARAVEITSNNSNTTYNFGRDVVNNNWVNNNFYPEKTAADPMKKQVRAATRYSMSSSLKLIPGDRSQCKPSKPVRIRKALEEKIFIQLSVG